jgi:general stress protein YciG
MATSQRDATGTNARKNARKDAHSTQRDNQEQVQGMSVAEAGRRGGTATARRYGSEFYREIGRKGGATRAEDADVKNGSLGRKGAAARWSHAAELQAAGAMNGGVQVHNGDGANRGRSGAALGSAGAINGKGKS